jgi:aspartyl-tRNA(Asn)/glutamyl-tRNA(Gln) amidotransferase subunit A
MPYQSLALAAEEIRAGIVTPGDLVDEALERIEERDGAIKAFVTITREQAYKDAAQAERELRTGLTRGPLHGIPIGVKDIIGVKGVRMTANSRVLADYIAPEDATVVELLRKAGAIIIGKTNTHEFAYGTYTPPTRNPWDTTRIPGGSSGGSAAAVAAAMCLGALGTDTGGSIRIPAACCGVTGLKPTYGRVSCFGVIPLSWTLDHVGPLARSAEDCALFFDAITGYDPRDPNSVSGPPGRTVTALRDGTEKNDPPSLQGMRIGLPRASFVDPLDPEVRQAWRTAARVLQEAGAAIIEDVDVPRPTLELYRTVQRPEATLAHMQRGWFPARAEAYGESTRRHLSEGQKISAVDYLRAQEERRRFASAVRLVLQRVDTLALPTLPLPAVPADMENISIDGIPVSLLDLTMPFNLSQLPAVSFPCGFTKTGLPIGLQVVGKPFEESTILRIAHAYQQFTDWHRREVP